MRELLQFELFALEERGRAKYLKLIYSRRELWEKAKPYLRTPVMKTLWTYDRGILAVADARFAGESALTRLSMLNEPQQPVIAITSEATQQARQEGVFSSRESLPTRSLFRYGVTFPTCWQKKKSSIPCPCG